MISLKDIKIGVLGGGVSPERKISLDSAQAVYQALLRQGIEARFIDINTTEEDKILNIVRDSDVDMVFIALHGEFGEDGQIQKILDSAGIIYSGSGPDACRLAMDKAAAKGVFNNAGILTPSFFVIESYDLPENIRYPLVVKPSSCGSSIGISIVDSSSALSPALESAFSLDKRVILEEYIEGREFTVGILDRRPLSIVEISPRHGFYDFKNKYVDGMTDFIVPALLEESITRDMKQIALGAHSSLGCFGFSRVDFRLNGNGEIYVLEVNSIPGLTSHSLLPLSAADCGIDFDTLILTMAKTSFSRVRDKNNREVGI